MEKFNEFFSAAKGDEITPLNRSPVCSRLLARSDKHRSHDYNLSNSVISVNTEIFIWRSEWRFLDEKGLGRMPGVIGRLHHTIPDLIFGRERRFRGKAIFREW